MIKNNKIQFIELNQENYGSIKKPTLDQIVQVGLDAFGEGMTGEEILEHIYPTDKLYLASCSSRIVGFATAKLKEDTVDLVGAAVKKEAQREGIYREFSLRRINLALTVGVSNIELRTQNPRIELGVRKCLDGLISIGLISSYSFEREQRRGLYGRMLTSRQPFCGVEEIDQFYTKLNYQKGDTFAFRFRMEK